eukprot:jgi/Picre1/34899/NNA_002365.t1
MDCSCVRNTVLAAAYGKSQKEDKSQIRAWFSSLSKDETPMVRRASAQALPSLIRVVEPGVVEVELLPMFQRLTEDEQDSVRLISVESCGVLATVLRGKNSVNDIIVPVLLRFAGDQSWRVRHQSALQLPDVTESAKKSVAHSLLLPSFLSLLQDSEAENSLAAVVTELSPLVGKDVTSKELLPIFLELLKDECSEARLGVIGKLDSVGSVVGVDLLSNSLMPAIEELAKDEHWRVRLAIISHVPLLAEQLGPDFLKNQLVPQCIGWLQDKVCAIREAAIETLEKLTMQFGPSWAEEKWCHQSSVL